MIVTRLLGRQFTRPNAEDTTMVYTVEAVAWDAPHGFVVLATDKNGIAEQYAANKIQWVLEPCLWHVFVKDQPVGFVRALHYEDAWSAAHAAYKDVTHVQAQSPYTYSTK